MADTFVNGYFRRDGTYVEPHYRFNPDGNFWNNWGTRGNVNPYTGQRGTLQFPNQVFPNYQGYSFPRQLDWSSPSYRFSR